MGFAMLKNIFILLHILVCFNIHANSISQTNGFIKIAYEMETVTLRGGDIIPESKVTTKAVSTFSLSTPILKKIFFLKREEICHNKKEYIGKQSKVATLVFDGTKWKELLYSIKHYDDNITETCNTAYLYKNTPNLLDQWENFYTAECFFPSGANFFANINNCSVADALSNKTFPKFDINKNGNTITLKGNTLTNKMRATLIEQNGNKILREYKNVYTDEATGHINLITETSFSGIIKIKNSNLIIPNKMERKFLCTDKKSKSNGSGYIKTISILSAEYLKEKPINFIPDIPTGWKIINLEK